MNPAIEHPPALPLSWRSIAAELVAIKQELARMEVEDAQAVPEPPLLGDPILFPTPESREAEIRRRHGEGKQRAAVTPAEVLRLAGLEVAR